MNKFINISEKEENEVIKGLAFVFIPIIIVIGIILFIQENSVNYQKKQYDKYRNTEYSGIITQMERGTYGSGKDSPHAGDLYLKPSRKVRVLGYIYKQLEIGDSLIKKSECDSIKFVKKTGKTFYYDENSFRRNKYLKAKL